MYIVIIAVGVKPCIVTYCPRHTLQARNTALWPGHLGLLCSLQWLCHDALSFNLNCRDSSVGRASVIGAGDRGLESRPHHTKCVIKGTSSSLADAHIKRGCAGKILGKAVSVKKILLCRNKSSTELMLFFSNKRRYIKLLYLFFHVILPSQCPHKRTVNVTLYELPIFSLFSDEFALVRVMDVIRFWLIWIHIVFKRGSWIGL